MNSEGLGEDWRTFHDRYLGETEEKPVQNLHPDIDHVLNCLSEKSFQSKACSTSILAQGFGYKCWEISFSEQGLRSINHKNKFKFYRSLFPFINVFKLLKYNVFLEP